MFVLLPPWTTARCTYSDYLLAVTEYNDSHGHPGGFQRWHSHNPALRWRQWTPMGVLYGADGVSLLSTCPDQSFLWVLELYFHTSQERNWA